MTNEKQLENHTPREQNGVKDSSEKKQKHPSPVPCETLADKINKFDIPKDDAVGVEDIKTALKQLKEGLYYDDEEDRFFLNKIDKIFGSLAND